MRPGIELADLHAIGALGKLYGRAGGVVLNWHSPFAFDSLTLDSHPFVFLAIDGLPVPYRVVELEERSQGHAIIHFDGIDSTAARTLQGVRVYASRENLLGELPEAEDQSLSQLVGLTLRDATGREIGTVETADTYSLNIVLGVHRADGTRLLVPFHQDLVRGLNPKAKELILELPDGLPGLTDPGESH